ncbi:hypothetical protein [Xanthocytophaga agilis]|uniref:N-acetyltransferase domain-containing protein n=1 Tax=Xanthocytophaga agilis TaxID=3048010 RepID=A0AAE3UHJ5_9BACT|nr:hypothetical protein [Xanthocytophaga agilis]MDJ1503552.1 hypothetical protein [Xanthocytophaga agilis]
MAIFNIIRYDLSAEEDHINFMSHVKDLLLILKSCYEEFYYGDSYYMYKLNLRNHIVLLSFIPSSESKLYCGCALYSVSGKISALAVLKDYRKFGVARGMVNYMQQDLPYLFAEIGSQNTLMQRFLQFNEFVFVQNKEEIIQNLKGERVYFVKDEVVNKVLVYIHSSGKKLLDIVKTKFVMLHWKQGTVNTTVKCTPKFGQKS